LREPLRIGKSPAGDLILVGPSDEFIPFDSLVASRAASILSVELAKQRAILEAQYRLQGDLVDDLLEGRIASEEAAVARGRFLGYDLRQPHIAVVLGVDLLRGNGGPGDQDLKTIKRFLEVARSEVLRDNSSAMILERHGSLSALYPLPHLLRTEQVLEMVERLRGRIQSALGGPTVTAGVGRYYEGLSGMRTSHREAQQALAIGQKVLGGGRSVHFARLGVYRLLFHMLDNHEVLEFQREVLGPLIEYDRKHGGELLQTLEAFFACNGNHVRTAQMLHLHRNTLLYRLDKIQGLLGADLADPETRLSIQMALKISQMSPHAGSGRSR